MLRGLLKVTVEETLLLLTLCLAWWSLRKMGLEQEFSQTLTQGTVKWSRSSAGMSTEVQGAGRVLAPV